MALRVAGVVVAGAGVATLAAPMVCSTRAGLGVACSAANVLLGPDLKLSVESASLSWRSEQSIQGVVLQDIDGGREYMQCDHITTSEGLLAAAKGGGSVLVSGLALDPGLSDSHTPILLEKLARSRLAGLPFLPKTNRMQVDELRGRQPSKAIETGDIPFEVDGATEDGTVLRIRGGRIALPPEAADCTGGLVRILVRVCDGDAGSSGRGRGPGDVSAPLGLAGGSVRQPEGQNHVQGDDLELLATGCLDKAWQSRGDIVRDFGAGAKPAAIVLCSPGLHVKSSGWISKDGRFLAPEPTEIEARVSTAPARRVLSRVSPLLGGVVGGDSLPQDAAQKHRPDDWVRMKLSPVPVGEASVGFYPSQSYSIDVDPMKLVIERGPVVDNLMWLLQRRSRLYKKDLVPAWTSRMKVKVGAGGVVKAERVDLLVAGIHVCTWGRLDPTEGLAVTLGIPATTIYQFLTPEAGAPALDPAATLQLDVTGPVSKPKIDWAKASRQLMAIGMQTRAPVDDDTTGAGSLMGRLLKRVVPQEMLAASTNTLGGAPLPVADLPWTKQPPMRRAETSVDP